jgi:sugar phosphate isomerase/epimerase
MKTGAMNYPKENLLEQMESIASMGFDFIDLTIEAPKATPEIISRNFRKIKSLLSKNKMFLTGHAAWFFEISHPYEGIRKAVVKEIGKALGVAGKLGIKKLTVHPHTTPGIYGRLLSKRLLEINIKSFREIAEIAEPLGISIMAENNPSGVFSRPDDFRFLFRKVPEVKFHLDVGHAFVAGGQKGISEFARAFRKRLIHVHVHDNWGQVDEHLPVGAGSIDFRKALAAIKGAGYNDTFTLEIHSPDNDYLKISRDKLLKIWKSV